MPWSEWNYCDCGSTAGKARLRDCRLPDNGTVLDESHCDGPGTEAGQCPLNRRPGGGMPWQ